MRVLKDAIFAPAKRGRGNLQVPDIALVAKGDSTPVYEELPDTWFIRLVYSNRGYRVAVGREQGFLHLSRTGWLVNKDKIKAAFLTRNPADKWEKFEADAEATLNSVKANTQREIDKLSQKMAALHEKLATT